MKILFIVEQCNPNWPSVPLVAYNLWNELAKIADVHLVTHARNRDALESRPWEKEAQHMATQNYKRKIDYIEESTVISIYYKSLDYIFNKLSTGWALYHALTYPVYVSFNRAVYKRYYKAILNGDYDIIHAFTPILPRYPVSVARLTYNPKDQEQRSLAMEKSSVQRHKVYTPFVLGPVNGGLPYPKGFQTIQRKEGAHFNFLRNFSQYIPNYTSTYLNAAKIFVGSQYTLSMLANNFPEIKSNMILFHENGVAQNFFTNAQKIEKKYCTTEQISSECIQNKRPLHLLFVGRLVSYKGVHFILEALALYNTKQQDFKASTIAHEYIRKEPSTKRQNEDTCSATLTIVGDGPEREALEKQSKRLGLDHCVHFVGLQSPQEVATFYTSADVFVFPSIREFGGAVVLEAMANGLACIVVNHGGIGEYIDASCGIRIKPISPSYIIQKIASSLLSLDNNRLRIKELGINAYEKAKKYTWSNKATMVLEEYQKLLKAYDK